MEMNNMTQWLIIGAAVVILVAGGTWLFVGREDSEPADTPISTSIAPTITEGTNSMPKGTQISESDGELVTVADQPAGDSVTLSAMGLTRASWVAVRDDMSILGASWFPSSATSGSVKLQRATESGKSYRVVIYVDDGDKKFDFKKDQLITADNAPVGASFSAN